MAINVIIIVKLESRHWRELTAGKFVFPLREVAREPNVRLVVPNSGMRAQ